jgi:hypothetical protein
MINRFDVGISPSRMPQHMPADFLRIRTRRRHLVSHGTPVHHDDPVRPFQDFVEVL